MRRPIQMTALAVAASALTVLATLTACETGPTAAGAARSVAVRAAPSPADAAIRSWEGRTQLVGYPRVGAEVTASYIRGENGPAVAAWDVDGGDLLWTDDASFGLASSRTDISLAAAEDGGSAWLAYLRPVAGRKTADVVVVDARTGEARTLSPGDRRASLPARCSDVADEPLFCVRTAAWGSDEWTEHRIDPRGDELVTEERPAAPPDDYAMGEGVTLVYPGGDASPIVRRTVDGAVTWERSLDEVLGTDISADSELS